MAEEKNYYIKVPGALVEVTEEVYLAYFRARRRWSAQDERNTYNGVISYDAMDTADTLGVDSIPDAGAPSVEDIVMDKILREKLRHSLTLLTEAEREMLQALYFDGLSERQVSKTTGIPQRTVHDRKCRALAKLKKLLNS